MSHSRSAEKGGRLFTAHIVRAILTLPADHWQQPQESQVLTLPADHWRQPQESQRLVLVGISGADSGASSGGSLIKEG